MPKLRPGITVLSLFTFLTLALLSVPCFADSQVRIVRLSDIQGDVVIDRADGHGFTRAVVNLPITQGVKLQTREDAFAEVEFEDGSTFRLTPRTEVEFTQLSLRDSGAKISAIDMHTGLAYVNFSASNGDQVSVTFGKQSVVLTEAAHLRVEMDPRETSKLAVFSGTVRVETQSAPVEVGKKQEATFNQDKSTVAKLEKDPLDEMDKRQDEYHQRYMAKASTGVSPYSYGVSDLYYYGNFFNAPGYGMMWQPYFAGAGWDPFMDGMWLYSSGYGYGWVSSYPWGWVPYHYGQWMYVQGYGWAWQPTGSWAGWNNTPRVINAPHRFATPQPPPTPGRTVMVRRGPTTMTERRSGEVVISRGSAGMGIPRGSIRNMGHVSSEVEKHGAVMLRSTPMQSSFGQPNASQNPSAAQNGTSNSRSMGAPPSRTQPSGARSPMSGTAPSGPRMGGMGSAPRSGGVPSRPR